jgi:hypothetical protein
MALSFDHPVFNFKGNSYSSPILIPEGFESWNLIGNYTMIDKGSYRIKVGQYISYANPEYVETVDFALCEQNGSSVLLYIVYTKVYPPYTSFDSRIFVNEKYLYHAELSYEMKEWFELDPYCIAIFISKMDGKK